MVPTLNLPGLAKDTESIFYLLKRKSQVKICRTDDEWLLTGCTQHMNTEDDGKVGISGDGTTTARSFEGITNKTLYCDVLQQELT